MKRGMLMQEISEDDYKKARRNGIPRNIVYQRVKNTKWSVEKAISWPIRPRKEKDQGEIKRLHKLAKKNGIDIAYSTVGVRIAKYWTDEEVVTTPKGQQPERLKGRMNG